MNIFTLIACVALGSGWFVTLCRKRKLERIVGNHARELQRLVRLAQCHQACYDQESVKEALGLIDNAVKEQMWRIGEALE